MLCEAAQFMASWWALHTSHQRDRLTEISMSWLIILLNTFQWLSLTKRKD